MSREQGSSSTDAAGTVLRSLWQSAGLAETLLPECDVPAIDDLLPSSFQVGLAAQSSIAAAASAAAVVYRLRSGFEQSVHVDRHAAERECTGYFTVDGLAPNAWEKFSGVYPTADGHVRIHANFDHHRDGALELLGLTDPAQTSREQVADALSGWAAEDFETAAAERGLVVAMVRSFDQWDTHPHALAGTEEPLISLTRIGDGERHPLAPLGRKGRPLQGLNVLDLTRILAGPICGRTLAGYGANVLLVNSPKLPNIASIVDTSRGKRSAHLDLSERFARERLLRLVGEAHVFVQGYRPGAMAGLGLAPAQLAARRPGLIYVSLSAYGNRGPWRDRRGFDSLVQAATGFNHAEAQAAASESPRSLPVPILDFASGFLMAFGAQAALLRQTQEGGAWHVEVSLEATARWLRSLGRRENGFAHQAPGLEPHLKAYPCTSGELMGMPHGAELSHTPVGWTVPSSPPGTHPPAWR